MAQPPEKITDQKDRCASRYQEIENSGIEIDPGNEGGEEDQVSETGAGSHLEREPISDEGNSYEMEKSIIKPKGEHRRVFGKRNGLGRKIIFSKHLKSGVEYTQDVSRVLIDAYKIQDGVKMYPPQLPGCGDYQLFIYHAIWIYRRFRREFL